MMCPLCILKEEERIATEKAELRREVDNEIKTLQQNLTKLQQVP